MHAIYHLSFLIRFFKNLNRLLLTCSIIKVDISEVIFEGKIANDNKI